MYTEKIAIASEAGTGPVGASVVGPPNPGHKEQEDECSAASSRRRIVHGQIEGP
jgi:hypothetical protein